MSDVTQILSEIEQGDPTAADELLPLIYNELRRLAKQKLAHEDPGQTLQSTALVHEAYIRLVDVERAQNWDSRGHFFAAAGEAMRRILIEQARRKKAEKRGGGLQRIGFNESAMLSHATPDQLLAVDDALAQLAHEEPEAAELVKLRLFAGFSVEDAARLLGMSRASGYRHWTYARAWLRTEFREGEDSAEKENS